ncbi:bifunctional phosphoribosylaminoimidazolecarboxamide formyltransferase/IMP cyclohydrolase [Sulfidibacter corallicola]|uniref:Bifunctional purine biosynthesis protein PurH n=1 Tax=Sulfidibacter corallicola TaxID=2818388 RepID=A0A8A4TCE6_SULCO|nr:bifunctional phosphoribosylaminoimidazolecarboxamide formyltransferase/IMP cyclohydrolase [Sulfidibacter corallicola]QTD47606.1 bifunctional phosphoribosylaminoimidazolecarboxamide formyltransferase/IMP cyclohydrolase [Sulfidibacter corallicola]
MMAEQKKRALISVSDKAGIAEFAEALAEKGFEIISSGGTYRHLEQAGLNPIKVADITGFPEILDGRVKTLHPHVHGALLARYELASHREQLNGHGIDPIQVVVVNLYPFAQTIAKEGVTVAEAIEQIDIGGPTMVRATAKNFQNLTILTDPADYSAFLEGVDPATGLPSLAFRLTMAQKAFQHTFSYDMKIADYLDAVVADERELTRAEDETLPKVFRMSAERTEVLRYGENPHQRAGMYQVHGAELPDYVTQHQGKLLSYNNLVDMEAAWRCACDFDRATAVVVKHTNPCGVASHDVLEEAFRRARKVDATSSFGGVIAFNREVDEATAIAINEQFAELVIAPAFSEAALKKFKRKKNLRVLEIHLPDGRLPRGLEFKRLDHGLLVQDKDNKRVPFSDWKLVSERQPSEAEVAALTMAWQIVPHVKSNAIVYADADGAVGIGAGQMSRVDSSKIGIAKAGEAGLTIAGCAMASDAFFPFRDSIDAAAAAGVRAIVEPGGSIRDEEVIQAANEHGIALFFTETRHFKH